MTSPLYYFAKAEAATGDADILSTLGVDVKLLIFQIVAFLILVWLLGKFVFPAFIRIVDKREAAIAESNKAAVEASKQAEKSKEETEKLLAKARAEAKEIVATAKSEADAMQAKSEQRSKEQAERTIANAQEEIAKEILAAKKALHNETIDLVTLATEKVVGASITEKIDNKVVADALKGAK